MAYRPGGWVSSVRAGDNAAMDTRVEGPSYPLRARIAASMLFAVMVLMTARLVQQVPPGATSAAAWLGLAAVLAAVVLGYLSIMRSRTALDDEAITQRWLFRKQVRLEEITQVRLFDPPALRWVVVPRFVVRTRGLRVVVFHVGDERVLAAARALIERGRLKASGD